MRYKDDEINQKIIEAYKNRDNKPSLKEQVIASGKYPELSDEYLTSVLDGIASKKTAKPVDENLLPMSTNTNVQMDGEIDAATRALFSRSENALDYRDYKRYQESLLNG